MHDPGNRQVQLPAVLVNESEAFCLAFGNQCADEFTIIEVFYKFSRNYHGVTNLCYGTTICLLLFGNIRNYKLVKSKFEAHRWLDKKFDIQGVVFLTVFRLYIWYAERLSETYNEGDRVFYDAIKIV